LTMLHRDYEEIKRRYSHLYIAGDFYKYQASWTTQLPPGEYNLDEHVTIEIDNESRPLVESL
jgi:hypothetical protein